MIIKISPEGVNITKRFFLALDTLQAQRRIRGLRTITERYGLNYWNMSTLRQEPEKRVLKSECLAFLVRDYNISAEWLLCGTGTMFKDSTTI
jgi:hypothetical protein